MRKLVLLLAVAVAVTLGGCAGMSKEDQGMVFGGVLGGLGGSMIGGGNGNVIATVAGAVFGGYLGREVGRHMDEQDRLLHERAVSHTVVAGRDSFWRNPDTRHHGRVEAGRHYKAPSGYCREYTERVTINGREVTAHGTACQQPDGSWRIMN